MAHGHVAVDTHHGQREDAGEHVVVIDGDEDFARHLAKRPGAEQVVGALEGHGGGDQSVGHSKVEDVDVGGCFHLGVSITGRRNRGNMKRLTLFMKRLTLFHVICCYLMLFVPLFVF